MFLSESDKLSEKKHGRKAANFQIIKSQGLQFPDGFVIDTDAVKAIYKTSSVPSGTRAKIRKAIEKLNRTRQAASARPLLVSVRSSPTVSVPGGMLTITNVGFNDAVVLQMIAAGENEQFAYDTFRRFIEFFGMLAFDIPRKVYDDAKETILGGRPEAEALSDIAVQRKIIARNKEIFKQHTGMEIPSDLETQLAYAIVAVARSWKNETAKVIRDIGERTDPSAAVIIQEMRFGNKNRRCASGVVYTRDPHTGENKLTGSFRIQKQGTFIVSGRDTGSDISLLAREFPGAYNELLAKKEGLEKQLGFVADIEFTIEDDTLYLLQIRPANIAIEREMSVLDQLEKEGIITPFNKIHRIVSMQKRLKKRVVYKPKPQVERTAVLNASDSSAGAIYGRLAFTEKEFNDLVGAGQPVILVISSTDIHDFYLEAFRHPDTALLIERGNNASHALELARLTGVPILILNQPIQMLTPDQVRIGAQTLDRNIRYLIDGYDKAVFTTADPEPLVPLTLSEEIDCGIDFEKAEREFRRDYIDDATGKLKVPVAALLELNYQLLERFKNIEQIYTRGAVPGAESAIKKLLLRANLEKHFAHNILRDIGAGEAAINEMLADYYVQRERALAPYTIEYERDAASGTPAPKRRVLRREHLFCSSQKYTLEEREALFSERNARFEREAREQGCRIETQTLQQMRRGHREKGGGLDVTYDWTFYTEVSEKELPTPERIAYSLSYRLSDIYTDDEYLNSRDEKYLREFFYTLSRAFPGTTVVETVIPASDAAPAYTPREPDVWEKKLMLVSGDSAVTRQAVSEALHRLFPIGRSAQSRLYARDLSRAGGAALRIQLFRLRNGMNDGMEGIFKYLTDKPGQAALLQKHKEWLRPLLEEIYRILPPDNGEPFEIELIIHDNSGDFYPKDRVTIAGLPERWQAPFFRERPTLIIAFPDTLPAENGVDTRDAMVLIGNAFRDMTTERLAPPPAHLFPIEYEIDAADLLENAA
ncbi:MAG TPA: PEP/pyruvate-binding domain-containing protein [bacterium]|nr:PEP/pyruvate-binding domain-containing protein [bacterium]